MGLVFSLVLWASVCGEEVRARLSFVGCDWDWDAVSLLRTPCKIVGGVSSLRVRVSVSGLLSGVTGIFPRLRRGMPLELYYETGRSPVSYQGPPPIMGAVATFAKRRLVDIPISFDSWYLVLVHRSFS